ncbi:MAG TPA: serine/threonine-protein kinase [Gemmataceae bacterium]|nr:serine/threonine-protein kinase [Gemmataceae bacterium]
MASETLITELLRHWEQQRQAGQLIPVEELCDEHPELADEVRQRIRLLDAMDRRIPQSSTPTMPGAAMAVTASRPSALISLLQPGLEPVPGYRLVEGLGRGGFGEVWKAEAPGGFTVALKFVLLVGRAGPAETRALDLIRHIRHPNLLATFGSWEKDGLLVIAMELADCTLGDRLAESVRRGRNGIPRDELLGYMLEAAKGLDYLNSPVHEVDGRENVSVQHRDIKPQNILLIGGGVKVADFGLARLLEQTVVSHSGSLTPLYAPPEFFNGQTTRTSDQYALAITYCQLRGGRLPFDGNVAQVTAGHLYRAPDLSMIQEAERPVVLRALAKEPEARWPSCEEFVEALASLYRQTPVIRADTSGAATTAVQVGEIRRFEGATEKVLNLTYSADGKMVLTGARTGAAILWDAQKGKEIRRFTGHTGVVRGVGFSPDARTALTGGDDGTVRLWDVRNGTEIKQLDGELGKVKSLAFSSDGSVLFGGESGQLRLWNPKTNQVSVFRGHVGRVCYVAFSPDGKLALSCGGDESVQGFRQGRDNFAIRLWEISSGRLIRSLEGHGDQVFHAVFSYDGRSILSGSADSTIRLWEVETGRERLCFRGHHGAVNKIDLSADGKYALSAGADRTIRVWRLPIGQRHRFTGHADRVNAVAFSPDGKHALSAASDGTIRLWGLPA